MNRFLLTLGLTALGIGSASAYFLPTPKIVSENKEDGKVTIEWTYDDSDTKATDFQVIVYKMHKAPENENFVLAKTDFDYIESKGTFQKHEERGAIWDYVQDCPGWWVKFPQYMDKAIGIDAFQYFPGSDNDDIFGGAYMISPDYDLSNVSNRTFKVKAQIANEAVSVTGGFAIWAWNINWFDPTNIDYKPVVGLDHHYDDLSYYNWKDIDEECTFPVVDDFEDPDVKDEVGAIKHERTRVMFYGRGFSAYWINGFEVSVDLMKGETIDYASSYHNVDADTHTFTIDTSADTDNDYTYAYEVKALRNEYDDYRDLTTTRFINYSYNEPKHVIGKLSGINDVVAAENNVKISVENGAIIVRGAEGATVDIYSTTGATVYSGAADVPVYPGKGIYLVKVGEKTTKVIL
ncbi:MAG: hypothetical protein K2L89_04795 [Muribaculaceae bacterium]|nr:hypothetical protein [Muribaculaceae bacterium]